MNTLKKVISGKEVEITFSSKRFSGHGHYKIFGEAHVLEKDETGFFLHSRFLDINYTTTNMPLIDAMNDDIDEVIEEVLKNLFDYNEKYIIDFVNEKE